MIPAHSIKLYLGFPLLVVLGVLGLLIVPPPHPVAAASCTSIATGVWSSPGTWGGCGGTPSAGDSVTISSGNTVALDVDTTVTTLVINSGGALHPVNPGVPTTFHLTVGNSDPTTGGFVNNGVFNTTNGNGTIDLTLNGKGSEPLTPGGATFNNLTVSTSDFGQAGYWKFDEGSGTTVSDSSGNGNNGTFTNYAPWGPPTWSSNVAPTVYSNANALTMDFGQGVIVPYSPSLDFSSNGKFSISVWIKSSIAITQTDGAVIVSNGNVGSEQYRLDFAGGYIRFTVWDNAGSTTSIQATNFGGQITSARGWVHVVAINNPSIPNGMSTYIDDIHDISTTAPSLLRANSNPLYMGHPSLGDNAFKGTIDDLRIYNRALSSDEVLRLWRGWQPNAAVLGSALDVNRDLTLNGSSLDVTDAFIYPVNLHGNWIYNGFMQPHDGTVTFMGTGLHTVTGNTQLIRFNNLTIPDGVIVEGNNKIGTIVTTFSKGNTSSGQLRHTPVGNAPGNCSAGSVSENDGTADLNGIPNTTLTLTGCANFTTANIRTAQGGAFPNIDNPGSPAFDSCTASINFVKRYWKISPDGSGNRTANVIFAYLPSELNSNNPNTLNIYRCVGGLWQQQSLSLGYSTSGAFNTVTANGLTIGSSYALASSQPTSTLNLYLPLILK